MLSLEKHSKTNNYWPTHRKLKLYLRQKLTTANLLLFSSSTTFDFIRKPDCLSNNAKKGHGLCVALIFWQMDGNLIHRCSFIAHIPVVKFHPKQTKTFQSHCICRCIKHCCSKIKSKKIPSKIQTSSIKMLIFPWLINLEIRSFHYWVGYWQMKIICLKKFWISC